MKYCKITWKLSINFTNKSLVSYLILSVCPKKMHSEKINSNTNQKNKLNSYLT